MTEALGWISSALLVLAVLWILLERREKGARADLSLIALAGLATASLGLAAYSYLVGDPVFVVTGAALALCAVLGIAIGFRRRRELGFRHRDELSVRRRQELGDILLDPLCFLSHLGRADTAYEQEAVRLEPWRLQAACEQGAGILTDEEVETLLTFDADALQTLRLAARARLESDKIEPLTARDRASLERVRQLYRRDKRTI